MSKVDYKTGRYSKALIDRIDGMVDEKEFDPYKAGKKLEASGEEMFDNNMYADDDKEELTEDDFDEAGLEISNRYRARYERAVQRESITPEMRVLEAEEALKKAEERVETMRVALEKAKADAKLALEQTEA